MASEQAKISRRAAAKLLGLTEGALRKWARRPDWGFEAPPYTAQQVEQIDRWALRTLRRGVRRVPSARPGEAATGIVPLVGAAADAAGVEPPVPRRRKRRPLAAGGLGGPADRKDGNVRAGPAAESGEQRTGNGGREDDNGDELRELSDAELTGLLAELVEAVRGNEYTAPLRADVLLKVQKIQSEQVRRTILLHEFLPREQVERDQNAKAHSFAVGLQQMERSLGSQFAGLQQHEAESALHEAHKALLYLFVGNKTAGAKAWRLAEEYLKTDGHG